MLLRARSEFPLAPAAIAVTGLALGVGLLWQGRRGRSRFPRHDKHGALVAYLREHLAGADVAIQVVDRLRHNQPSAEDRAFFEFLHANFTNDRGAVTALLVSLGESPRSLKRVASRASGSLLKLIAGGDPGDLGLFRTLEALSIGVQGKRCLWRALKPLQPTLSMPGGRSLSELESAAVSQWDAIEARRSALVTRTFELGKA